MVDNVRGASKADCEAWFTVSDYLVEKVPGRMAGMQDPCQKLRYSVKLKGKKNGMDVATFNIHAI